MKTASMKIILALVVATAALAPAVARAADHHHHHHHGSHKPADPKRIYTVTGVMDSIDKAAKRAVITHDPVPALGWPLMTMGFVFEDAALMDGLKAGDKVRLDFRHQGNVTTIVDIETIK